MALKLPEKSLPPPPLSYDDDDNNNNNTATTTSSSSLFYPNGNVLAWVRFQNDDTNNCNMGMIDSI